MHRRQAAIKLDRMSLAFIISLVIQVVLIIHCIRSGRNTLWIWAIALLPLAGPVAYVLVEVLPGLFGSHGTRRAVRGMRKALDPEQDLRRFEAEMRRSGDVASRQRYADELLRQGKPLEAIAIYQQALSGLYESDPNLLLGLAQLRQRNNAAAQQAFDKVASSSNNGYARLGKLWSLRAHSA